MAETGTAERVAFAPVAGASELFSDAFLDYLVHVHEAFAPRIDVLRARRAEVLRRALDGRRAAHPSPCVGRQHRRLAGAAGSR